MTDLASPRSASIVRRDRRANVDAAVERLKGFGATQGRVVDRDGQYFVEMADPEGNWFCVQ